MEREIKFRGLRTDGKCWVYGDIVQPTQVNPGLKYISENITCIESEDDGRCIMGRFIEVVPKSVGQYTGLKDKNGVDIYEGDILMGDDDREITVNWFTRLASFCLDAKGWAWSHFFDEALHPSNVVVTGNIHEPKKTP